MPASRQDLFDRLAALGIPTRTTEHRPVFTVAESAQLERDLPGGHTKNLFLKDTRGALFLVVAHSATRIDLKALPKVLGARRFSFGSAALLLEVLGVPPGSVTPFALINDTSRRVQVVVDAVTRSRTRPRQTLRAMTFCGSFARADTSRASPYCRSTRETRPRRGLRRAEWPAKETTMDFGVSKPAAAGGGADADIIKNTTTAAFARDVLEASRKVPVIVDFWAPWCGPCKQLTPVLEKAVRAAGGKVRLVKINIDEHPAIAQQLRVQSIPTVYAFRDGRPLDGFMGAQPESAVRAFVDRLLGDEAEADIATVLKEAEAALEAGDLQSAAEIFAAVLREDQQNPTALAGLARAYLISGDTARAEQTIALVPPDKRELAAVKSVRAALDLARMADASDNRGELEARLAANPADHQARYDLAVALAARGEKEAALDHLLEIVRRDRNWNDQAARKQLVQLFDAWGPKDPATSDGRRRLSSILFS